MNRTYRTLSIVHVTMAALALAVASPAAWADDDDDDDDDVEIPWDEDSRNPDFIGVAYRSRCFLCRQLSTRSTEKKYCRYHPDVEFSAQAVFSLYSDHLIHLSSTRNSLGAIRACQR